MCRSAVRRILLVQRLRPTLIVALVTVGVGCGGSETTLGLRLTLQTGEVGTEGGTVILQYTRVDTGDVVSAELPSNVPCDPLALGGCDPRQTLQPRAVDTLYLNVRPSITLDDGAPIAVRDVAFEYIDASSGWDFAGFVLEALLEDGEFDLSNTNNPRQLICEGSELVRFTESGSYVPPLCP